MKCARDYKRQYQRLKDRLMIQSVALASAHTLVFDMPVFLLTPDGTVTGIPATMIHGFFFAVVTLTNNNNNNNKVFEHQCQHVNMRSCDG